MKLVSTPFFVLLMVFLLPALEASIASDEKKHEKELWEFIGASADVLDQVVAVRSLLRRILGEKLSTKFRLHLTKKRESSEV